MVKRGLEVKLLHGTIALPAVEKMPKDQTMQVMDHRTSRNLVILEAYPKHFRVGNPDKQSKCEHDPSAKLISAQPRPILTCRVYHLRSNDVLTPQLWGTQSGVNQYP